MSNVELLRVRFSLSHRLHRSTCFAWRSRGSGRHLGCRRGRHLAARTRGVQWKCVPEPHSHSAGQDARLYGMLDAATLNTHSSDGGQVEGKRSLAADARPQVLLQPGKDFSKSVVILSVGEIGDVITLSATCATSLSPRPDKVAMNNAAFDHFANLSNSATSTATSGNASGQARSPARKT